MTQTPEKTYETLDWQVDADGVATVTLTRPDALNAFDLTMARELESVFRTELRSDDVRAVVVTGAGRAFCAGMDLSAEGNVFGLDESLRPTPEEFRAAYDEAPYDAGVRDTGGKVTLAVHALPKPVIAAINGPAVGIGATMTLAMDLRLASTKAKIGFVFGRLGIVPEAASSWFLPRIVGVVTSPTGAVIRDILHRLDDRFPSHVLVWPVRVQGDTCAPEVVNAIEGFNAFLPEGPIPRPDRR